MTNAWRGNVDNILIQTYTRGHDNYPAKAQGTTHKAYLQAIVSSHRNAPPPKFEELPE